jgi:hypothetical protein
MRIIEGALTLFLVLRAGSRIFECIESTLLVKRIVKYKGSPFNEQLNTKDHFWCYCHQMHVARITTNWIRSHTCTTIAFFLELELELEPHVRIMCYSTQSWEVEARSLVNWNTKFMKRIFSVVELYHDVFSLCCIHATKSITLVPYMHHADSHYACNFRAEVLDLRNGVNIDQHPTLVADQHHACRGAFLWCHIHESASLFGIQRIIV